MISQKSKLAEAIRYALTRWDGLTRFLDDGRIEIDSNVVERSIRPIALNRKNALFAGSDGGAEHWGVLASLIETSSSIKSIPRPTSPMSSRASSTAILIAASTNCCPGPIRWPENSAYAACVNVSGLF